MIANHFPGTVKWEGLTSETCPMGGEGTWQLVGN